MARSIYFRELALKDIRDSRLTYHEFSTLYREVKRVAESNDIDTDQAVCRVVQTRGLWYRLKIVQPSQLRVFFTIEDSDNSLTVEAVLRRTENCYNIAKILWKARSK